jgi:hypothetical protein
MPLPRPSALCAACSCAAALAAPAYAGDFDHTVTFVDPTGLGAAFQTRIDQHLGAALAAWGRHLDGQASFEILVNITPNLPTSAGTSATSAFVGYHGGANVFEQGMAYELRTGLDPNGAAPDIVLEINPAYLQYGMWFDPDPSTRTAPVGPDRVDATSVFIHEIGHALAFNGWGDDTLGASGSISTWDRHSNVVDGVLAFTGPHAVATYGAGVPITFGYDFHIGNSFGAGTDLQSDVMNGVALLPGQRYDVSELNLAMLRDMGLAVSPVPEPATVATMLAGLAALAGFRRRRRMPRDMRREG